MLILGQKDPPSLKFHNGTDINMYSITLVLQVKMSNICIAYYIIYTALFVHNLQYKCVVHTVYIQQEYAGFTELY